MTNNDELAIKLKAAARKAVPGPWGIARDGITVVSNQSHPVAKVSNAEHRMLSDLSTGMDAEFIATANPANILSLLAERDADKKRIAQLEARAVIVNLPEPFTKSMYGTALYEHDDIVTMLAAAGFKLEVGE